MGSHGTKEVRSGPLTHEWCPETLRVRSAPPGKIGSSFIGKVTLGMGLRDRGGQDGKSAGNRKSAGVVWAQSDKKVPLQLFWGEWEAQFETFLEGLRSYAPGQEPGRLGGTVAPPIIQPQVFHSLPEH